MGRPASIRTQQATLFAILDMACNPQSAHDSEYYFEDGNVVILVENTFFKLHRSRLTMDTSAFDTLFATEANLSCESANEGESDENPIALKEDRVDSFRALCWALYGLPCEHGSAIAACRVPDLLLYYRVIFMTHKYGFATTEKWALGRLASIMSFMLNRFPTAPLVTTTTTPSIMAITELAHHWDGSLLLDVLQHYWDTLFGRGEGHVVALVLADQLDMRRLLGTAFYATMLRGERHWIHEHSLTEHQREALREGQRRFVAAWDALHRNPPMPKSLNCYNSDRHQDYFEESWTQLWQFLLGAAHLTDSNIRSPDVLGMISALIKVLLSPSLPLPWESEMFYMEYQRDLVEAMLDEKRKLQETLCDWFLPPDTSETQRPPRIGSS